MYVVVCLCFFATRSCWWKALLIYVHAINNTNEISRQDCLIRHWKDLKIKLLSIFDWITLLQTSMNWLWLYAKKIICWCCISVWSQTLVLKAGCFTNVTTNEPEILWWIPNVRNEITKNKNLISYNNEWVDENLSCMVGILKCFF